MCLALPAKVLERNGLEAWVRLGDAKMRVSLIMTPEAQVDEWVLVHAGFAIHVVPEADALETWQLIESIQGTPEEATP
jgi:hydrogenase expression/formation protein HypC